MIERQNHSTFVIRTPSLPLPLLVLGVLLVDDVDAALATNNLVVGTALLYAGAYFHDNLTFPVQPSCDSYANSVTGASGAATKLLLRALNADFNNTR